MDWERRIDVFLLLVLLFIQKKRESYGINILN